MSKVYIVTSGDYSDYRIDAVFSTKEKAEEVLVSKGHMRKEEKHGYVHYGPYSIEEHDLDPDDTGTLPSWGVRIETDVLANNITTHSWSADYGLVREGRQATRDPVFARLGRWIPGSGQQLRGWSVSYRIEAETKELAEKIAADWRREDIAMGKLDEWERQQGINQPRSQ